MDHKLRKPVMSNFSSLAQLISGNCSILKKYCLHVLFILVFGILGHTNIASAFFCGPESSLLRQGEISYYFME